MEYTPEPLDTSGVELDARVRELLEQLAGNTHDIWAQQRLADGWRYGPRRDDVRREHPGLVPYEQLSEEEKEYDRKTALGILEAIVALGYRIEPTAEEHDEDMEGTIAGVIEQCRDPKADAATLVAVWRSRDAAIWSRSPEIYECIGARLLEMGSPIAAHEVLVEALDLWPDHIRLRQLQARALTRLHITDRAREILAALYAEGADDEETMGNLARAYKDQALAAEGEERLEALRLAYARYRESYERNGGSWSAINAATLALLLDDRDTAHELARQVLEQYHAGRMTEENLYWRDATLGEAHLVLEQWAESEEWYGKAYARGRNRIDDLASTRRNAHLILDYLGKDRSWIDRVLPLPRVVLFAGHMIDRPGRATPRFPPEIEGAVKRAIDDEVSALDGRIGFASGACGADILFLEAVRSLKGHTHIVLPAEEMEFRRESVDIIPGSSWSDRFSRMLADASEQVITAGQVLERGGLAYDYANMVLQGLAQIRAELLGAELVGLAVWDGKPGDGPGGTASTVARWQEHGLPVRVINTSEILAREMGESWIAEHSTPRPSPIRSAPRADEYDAVLTAVLFADVVKFSQLSEAQIPPFVEQFLGAIGRLSRELADCRPMAQNTWGDGLYFVFEHVRDAGLFALELCRLVQSADWTLYRLPEDLNLRIGVHAGPVYRCRDPITENKNYIGTHVSRGARIEPITPPGQVYASQAFAALASVEHIRDFRCELVKRMEWAKRYGSFPTYVVRRA